MSDPHNRGTHTLDPQAMQAAQLRSRLLTNTARLSHTIELIYLHTAGRNTALDTVRIQELELALMMDAQARDALDAFR